MAIAIDIPGYTLRRPTLDDVGPVVELIRECELADSGSAERTEEDVSTAWRMIDLDADAWLVVDEHGQPVAAAALRKQHPTRMFVYPAVAPAHRRRGIGARLLALAEERARDHIPKAPAGARVALAQPVGEHNSGARALLERHGYAFVRRFWQMELDLARELPAPAWPDGIRLETYAPERGRAIFDAIEEAFQDHWNFVPQRFDEFRAWHIDRESFDGSLWFLGLDGDEIAGASLCAVRDGVGWVNILGVRRPWRRSGLGLALLHQSFAAFRARGLPRAALGVDSENPTGATRLYERAGMFVSRHSDAYEKVLREGSVTPAPQPGSTSRSPADDEGGRDG